MELPSDHIFEFGDFRLVPAEGLLLRHGQPVPLSIKAFATLVFLVERHGHLVQKSELLNEIWGETFVEEAAVSRCVWNVRNALGDTSKETFIKTIPRRGYRFVFPVTVISDPLPALGLSGSSVPPDSPQELAPGIQRSATNGSAARVSVITLDAEASELAIGETESDGKG